jgi:translation initiation factor IF-3
VGASAGLLSASLTIEKGCANIAIEQQIRINERIRVPQVRLIDHEGTQVGVIATMEALRMAREAEMDLVEVAPTERPPVCRIMDFGKQKYRQNKKQKKHVHEQQLKELRLRPNTDTHDLEVKIKKAREFLKRGDRVQFTMMMRGRERFHTDMALASMRQIADGLTECSHVERPARAEGRRITMVIVPGKAPAAIKPDKPGLFTPAAAPAQPAAQVSAPVAAQPPTAEPASLQPPVAGAPVPAQPAPASSPAQQG